MENLTRRGSFKAMIKILIVDDSTNRSNKLIKKIKELNNFPFCEIDYACFSNKAEELLSIKQYDLLVLDVVLPKKLRDTPTAKIGLNLLKNMNKTSSKLHLPRKIIGITGYIDDIKDFKEEFEIYTSNILEAKINKLKWIRTILNYIEPLLKSDISANNIEKDKLLITFHGIRTYAPWQEEIENLMGQKVNNFSYEQIKYAYYSIFLFILPFFRKQIINYLYNDFEKVLEKNKGKKIFIITHSFGTYVAVKLLEKSKVDVKIEALILAGSVLPNTYNLSSILGKNVKKIVNECARSDFTLIFNKLFVPSFSDAGRIGFVGRNNKFEILNRFHSGGHSVYFKNIYSKDNIINTYWLPILIDNNLEIKNSNDKFSPPIYADITEPILTIWFQVKNIFLLFIFPVLTIYYFFYT